MGLVEKEVSQHATEELAKPPTEVTSTLAQRQTEQVQQLGNALKRCENTANSLQHNLEEQREGAAFPRRNKLENEIKAVEQARDEAREGKPKPETMDRAYGVFESRATTEQKEEIAKKTAEELKNQYYPELAMKNMKKFLDENYFQREEKKGEGNRVDEFFRTCANNMTEGEKKRFFSEKELRGLRSDIKPVEPRLPDYAKTNLFLSRVADYIAKLSPEERKSLEQRINTRFAGAVPRLK